MWCGVAVLHSAMRDYPYTSGGRNNNNNNNTSASADTEICIKHKNSFCYFYFISFLSATQHNASKWMRGKDTEVGFLCKQVENGRARERESFEFVTPKRREKERERNAANASNVM